MNRGFLVSCILLTACVVLAGEIVNMDPAPAKGMPATPQKTIPLTPWQMERAADQAAEAVAVRPDVNGRLDDCLVPFPEGFETAVVPTLPDCWVQINVNNDSKYWVTTTSNPHTGTKCARIHTDGANKCDDWLISAGMTLYAGSVYQLTFWRRNHSPFFSDSLGIMYGAAQTVAGMTELVASPYDVNDAEYVQDVFTIFPSVTQTYYFGFHCISEPYMWYLYLDDIAVEEVPSAPDLAVSWLDPCGDNNPDPSATVSFRITNIGGVTSTPTMAHFSFDNGVTTGDHAVPAITPFSFFDVFFSTTINLTNGAHTLNGWVDPQDVPAANDSAFCALNIARPCDSMTPPDAVLDPVPTIEWAGIASGDCGNGGKWVGEFTAEAGVTYHFDLCPLAPGDGNANFDADIKIVSWSGMLIPGEDGMCVIGGDDEYLPNDWSWTAPSDSVNTYYVVIAPYWSYESHNCEGSAGHTFTLNYYAEPPQPCETYTLCGTPAEIEPNDVCPAPLDQTVIDCDMTVHGLHCPIDDHDFWKIIVPPATRMYLHQYEGTNCDVTPTNCIQTKIRNGDCGYLTEPSVTGWILTNDGAEPWVVYGEVFNRNDCASPYKLVTTCVPVVNYCSTPIVVPGVLHYEATVNTTNGINVIPCIREVACSGTCYESSNDVIFLIDLHCDAIVSFTVTGPGSADEQILVTNDCEAYSDTFDCIASADMFAGNIGGETISNLSLPAGMYYVVMSYYANANGDLTLVIDSDCPLSVELSGFDAIPQDSEVEITWGTSSEANNDHFDIVRDGETVAQIPTQGNGPTGHTYSWMDNIVTNGTTYAYSLVAVDVNNTRQELAAESVTPNGNLAVVTEYALHQNYPNPFNPGTTISFDLVDAGNVTLAVYNLMGQEVVSLVKGEMSAGRHTVNITATNLPSGVYLYKLNVNGFSANMKMLLMR